MKRLGTTLFALFLMSAAGVSYAQECTGQNAQEVTIRQINDVSQDAVDELMAAGTSLTQDRIIELLQNDLTNQCVKFTAVILTDPLNSGLANVRDGNPSRIHVYVRDTSAASLGVEGMGLQLVDGSYETTGMIDATVGDVIDAVGVVSPFVGSGGVSMQIAPESITLIGNYVDFDLPQSILEPVTITTADANMSVEGEGKVQVNWENIADLNGQLVRLENATVVVRDISSQRPNWLVTTDGGETVLNFYDMSIRYRNDRSDYPDKFNKPEDDFVPPPPGSRINLTGTLAYQGDDPFNRASPEGALLSIVPWADADLVITESPPLVTELTGPEGIPGSTPIDVAVDVQVDPKRTLEGVDFKYFTSEDADTVTLAGTNTEGTTFTAQIPAVGDGVFVVYWAEAEDSEGAISTIPAQSYRVLTGGIKEIQHIQMTAREDFGDSPFAGLTTDMELTATVMTDPATSGMIVLQDDADLNPWTGVFVRANDQLAADLNRGDVINITNATIEERFGLTRLTDLTYTKTGSGDPLAYKVITTDALTDNGIAEAHEGMMLRFEDVTVTSTNPDAPRGPYGEWGLSSDGSKENQVRADDNSDAFGSDFAAGLSVWEKFTFQQGAWAYSFNNYKLWPETIESDIGTVTNVSVDDSEIPGAFALAQNYPNPFNPVTTIEYSVPASATVTLEVLDMLGRRVALLVDGEQAPGSYTVSFDGQELSSGMYIYRLSAGSQSMTRKMMLLK